MPTLDGGGAMHVSLLEIAHQGLHGHGASVSGIAFTGIHVLPYGCVYIYIISYYIYIYIERERLLLLSLISDDNIIIIIVTILRVIITISMI